MGRDYARDTATNPREKNARDRALFVANTLRIQTFLWSVMSLILSQNLAS